MEAAMIDNSAKTESTSFEKLDELKEIIIKSEKAAIAFSGGVDSTFLLRVCFEVLGNRALALTADSETYPARELEESKKIAEQIGVEQIIFKTDEINIPGFSENSPSRCYFCKKALFTKIQTIAKEKNISQIFDGSNLNDVSDFRPGFVALNQLKIRSPLIEARLFKDEIRLLSKKFSLPTWNKPAMACLSSRFPYYSKITVPKLKQVENAERFLWEQGMRTFRVRHHDEIARLELGPQEQEQIYQNKLLEKIVNHLKSLGYKYITLDLEGFRSGSMNETLKATKLKMEINQ